MKTPFEQLATWARTTPGDAATQGSLLHRLLCGAYKRILKADRIEDFDEIVGRLTQDDEPSTPDLFWEAACLVGARMRSEEEALGLGPMLSPAALEADKIELDMNDHEGIWEEWKIVLSRIAKMSDDSLALEDIAHAEQLAEELRSVHPEVSTRVLARLADLREER